MSQESAEKKDEQRSDQAEAIEERSLSVVDEHSGSGSNPYERVQSLLSASLREALTNSVNRIKHAACRTQQPGHINGIDEGANTATQRFARAANSSASL